MRLRPPAIGRLLRINIPLFIRTLSLQVVFVSLSIFTARLGPDEASAIGLFLVLLATAAYALDGFANASEIEAGQSFGQQNFDRFKCSLWAGVILSLITAVVVSILIAIFGESIISLLTHHPGAISKSIYALEWFTTVVCILCVSYWLDGVFIGLTRTLDMCIAMISATTVGWFGSIYIFGLSSLDELLFNFTLFSMIRTLMLGVFLPNAITKVRDFTVDRL